MAAQSSQQVSATTAAQILDAPVPPVTGPTKTGDLPAGASKTQSQPVGAASASATPPASDPKPVVEAPVSPKLQLLIQRERAAVERERSAAAKEQAIADREAKLTAFESAKSTPLKALELLGLTYQDITQAQMNEGVIAPETEIKKVHERLNAFVKSQEDERRQQEENSKKQMEQQTQKTIATFKGEINKYLEENPARYELIKFEENEDLVYQVIDEHYNRTLKSAQEKAEEDGEDVADIRGEVMTIAQASDKVEEFLEKKYVKARDLSKVKALSAVRPNTSTSNVPKPNTIPRQTPKTLNNQLSATAPTPKPNRILTDDERVAKAVAYAKGIRP